jgi:DNA-binding FrmR family transcriptional regulator
MKNDKRNDCQEILKFKEVQMKEQTTTHLEEIVPLKRIEGQIRGIQKMIEEKRYCIDILTQISSVVGAIKRVEKNILNRHLRGCVRESFAKGNRQDREAKINEVIGVLSNFRR